MTIRVEVKKNERKRFRGTENTMLKKIYTIDKSISYEIKKNNI